VAVDLSSLLLSHPIPLEMVERFSLDIETMNELYIVAPVVYKKIKNQILEHLHIMFWAHLLNANITIALEYLNVALQIFARWFTNIGSSNDYFFLHLHEFSMQAEKLSDCIPPSLQEVFQQIRIKLHSMTDSLSQENRKAVAFNSFSRCVEWENKESPLFRLFHPAPVAKAALKQAEPSEGLSP
jgi:hypothetical protein